MSKQFNKICLFLKLKNFYTLLNNQEISNFFACVKLSSNGSLHIVLYKGIFMWGKNEGGGLNSKRHIL